MPSMCSACVMDVLSMFSALAVLHIGYDYWRVGMKTLLPHSRGLTKVSKQPHEYKYWISIGPELWTS